MDQTLELTRARQLVDQKDEKAALPLLREIIQKNPRSVEAWMLLAEAVGDPAKAVQCLERVLALDPGNPGAQARLDALRNPQLEPEPEIYNPWEAGAADLTPPRTAQYNPWESTPAADSAPPPIAHSEPEAPRQPVQAIESAPPHPSRLKPVSGQVPADRPAPAARPERATGSLQPQAKPAKGWSGVEIFLLVVVLVLGLMILTGGGYMVSKNPALLGFATPTPTQTNDEVLAVVYENIRASNYEDIPAYMATIHSRSWGYNSTQTALETMVSEYDLRFSIYEVYVVERSAREARVHFVLITEKVNGPAFRNNRVEGVFILRPDEGKWKIYTQEVDQIEYYD